MSVDHDPTFRVVYPQDFGLPVALGHALDAAGIAHQPGSFPHVAESGDVRVAYLVEAERLAALGPRAKISHALEVIERDEGAVTIVVAEPGDRSMAWLAEDDHVAGWLVRPLDATAVVATVTAARRLLNERREIERLRDMAGAMTRETDRLLSIGIALSAERNISKLHELIVRNARELTRADSGSLFLLEPGIDGGETKLRFAVAQTGPKDAGTHLGAVLPLKRDSISGYVAITGDVVRVPDAYEIPASAEYSFNPSFDKQTGYRTKSVLVVPMRDHENGIVGVIMLINRKPSFDLVLSSPAQTESIVTPFNERDESVLLSLASQAGVALENKALLASIQDLFEQFVRASVKAIEVRDKSTQGHSSRVAELTIAQALVANTVDTGRFRELHFDEDALREMRYAALLHDFGKVAVPEYIFGKAKKLPDGRLDAIRLRFLLAINQIETLGARRKFDLLQRGGKIDDPAMFEIEADTTKRIAELQELLTTVETTNEPRVVAAETGALLDSILGRTYKDIDEERPLVEAAEFDFLRIPRGSLSNDERHKMEQHVTQSFYFLREIPWAKTPWRNVPELAYGHHEHLDGTGYPRGLKDGEIAPQVRMLTIADVYDALTAKDRPYKAAMPVERALDILVKEFAQRGKVDSDLLDLFIERKVYEKIAENVKA